MPLPYSYYFNPSSLLSLLYSFFLTLTPLLPLPYSYYCTVLPFSLSYSHSFILSSLFLILYPILLTFTSSLNSLLPFAYSRSSSHLLTLSWKIDSNFLLVFLFFNLIVTLLKNYLDKSVTYYLIVQNEERQIFYSASLLLTSPCSSSIQRISLSIVKSISSLNLSRFL